MKDRIRYRFSLIRPLLIPLILYIGALAFAMQWLEANPDSGWRYVVALAPMLPGIWMALGMLRAITRLDELERRILLEAAAGSFAITLLLMLSMGLLGFAGLAQLNGVYIAGVMAFLLLLGKLWGNWKNR